MNNPMWTLQEARILCEQVEIALRAMGAHVALGGSCLYRGSSDKDVDLFIYPHKTTAFPSENLVVSSLCQIGFKFMRELPREQYGDGKRVLQFEYQEKRVDVFMMFPVELGMWTFSGVDVAYTNSNMTDRQVLRYENAPQGWIRQDLGGPAPAPWPTPPTMEEMEYIRRRTAEMSFVPPPTIP